MDIFKIILLLLIFTILSFYIIEFNSNKINYGFLPKNIYVFWDKGFENMPKMCKKCVNSWIAKNPEYKVIVLDKSNIYNYLDKEFLDKVWTKNQIQTQSDLIRINLLSRYGGIWVDATLFCIKPLKSWLKNNFKSSLFMFKYHCGDCTKTNIASWFIASCKNCYLTNEMAYDYNNYWSDKIKSDNYFNFHEVVNKTIFKNSHSKYVYGKIPFLEGYKYRAIFHGINYITFYNFDKIKHKNFKELPLIKFNQRWEKFNKQKNKTDFIDYLNQI